jgi:hypothetical protein
MMSRAARSRRTPAGLSRNLPPERSVRLTPRRFSASRIRWLTAEGVSHKRSATAVMESTSARVCNMTVAYADIPAEHLIRDIYESDDVLAFIRDVLGLDALYRHADPLAALNLQGFTEAQQLGWHFDRSAFSVTLSIQAAESGGDFEYVRMLRNPESDCYEAVQRFLDDPATQQIEVLPQVPGTLTLFRGRYSLHRVTPVQGLRPRFNAVLAFVDQPNVEFSAYARQLFYGRTSAEPLN